MSHAFPHGPPSMNVISLLLFLTRQNLETLVDGIHASYFFPPETIALKLRSFAHMEASSENFTKVEAIKQRIKDGRDPRELGIALKANDPISDRHLMRFTPAARALLLSFSAALVHAQI